MAFKRVQKRILANFFELFQQFCTIVASIWLIRMSRITAESRGDLSGKNNPS